MNEITNGRTNGRKDERTHERTNERPNTYISNERNIHHEETKYITNDLIKKAIHK